MEKIARDASLIGLVASIGLFLILTIVFLVEEGVNGWPHSGLDYANEILDFFLISLATLVVSIPEGLPLAVTLSLAFSVNQM